MCSSASGADSDTLSQGALSDELADSSDHSDAGLIGSGGRCSSGDLEDGGLGLSSHSGRLSCRTKSWIHLCLIYVIALGMKGIGIVVGKRGVGMREASHFPSGQYTCLIRS